MPAAYFYLIALKHVERDSRDSPEKKMPEIEVEGERDEAHQDDSVENENLICSICLEQVNESGDRSIARLVCKHQFHLGQYSLCDLFFKSSMMNGF